MPELPEVEVTRRSFAEAIAGAQINAVVLGKPLRWPLGCDPQFLVGQTILGLRRRGKYLLLDMTQGLLLMHLGMSGSMRFSYNLSLPGIHDHFDLVTSQGTLRLHDPRRFGAVIYVLNEKSADAIKLLGALGMEPLSESFSLTEFQAGLKRSRMPIKSLLLGGKVVVGVGNIYACEVLFRAGIRPTVAAQRIGAQRVGKLYEAIRVVLAQAVDMGGTTLRDFSNAHGVAGHFQSATSVYGRAGELCYVCGSLVRLARQGQRSTYFCPGCQRG